MYNYIFSKMSQSLIEAIPVAITAIGENVKKGVTGRALSGFSILDRDFLHEGGDPKFSTVVIGRNIKDS